MIENKKGYKHLNGYKLVFHILISTVGVSRYLMNDTVNEWKEEVNECGEKGEGQKEGRARGEKGAEREGKEERRREN